MQLAFEVKNRKILRLIAQLGEGNRQRLHLAAANALQVLCRSWLLRAAAQRHGTAAKLGAPPTGHLEEAARTMTAGATAAHGEVVITSPGFSRVFGPLTIRPVKAKALTIPLSAFAYGHRVGELKANGWSIFRPKGKRVLMGAGPDGAEAQPLYALAASARIPQDRGLLPPDREMASAAGEGMREAIVTVLKRAGVEAA